MLGRPSEYSHSPRDLQSAYREDHSTNTTLLKVHHDIVETLDKKGMAALVPPDLSAAFDVTDYRIRRLIEGNQLQIGEKTVCVGVGKELGSIC